MTLFQGSDELRKQVHPHLEDHPIVSFAEYSYPPCWTETALSEIRPP